MKRRRLILIFYSFVCFYIVACEANHTSFAAPIDRKKNTAKKTDVRFELVPPPPPQQPSFLDLSNMPNLSTSFNLFNDAELKQRLAHLKVQIVHAKESLVENNNQLNDAKEESERFNSLFADGIISRKELEGKRKGVIHKEHLAIQAQNDLEDLQLQETAILRRLGQSKKSDKSKIHSFRNKTDKHEFHK